MTLNSPDSATSKPQCRGSATFLIGANMPITPVTAPSLLKSPAPFSPATITPAGRLLHVSGQVSQGPDGKTIGLGNVALQTEAAIENLNALLMAAGASLANVCRVVIHIVSRDHLADVIAVRKRYFQEPYPAATVVIGAGLAIQEWLKTRRLYAS